MASSSPTCTLPYSNIISTIILHEKIIEISERNIVIIWWYSRTENQKDQISCTLYLFIWSYVQYFFLCVYAYLYLFVCLLDIWEIILILKILFDHKQILDCHSSEIKIENIPQNYIKQASLHFLKYLNIYFLSIFPDQPVSFLRNFYRFSE